MVGGTTTSAVNPLQTRNTVDNGSTTANANPSSLYGDLREPVPHEHQDGVQTPRRPTPSPTTRAATPPARATTVTQAPGAVRHRLRGQGAAMQPNGGVTRQWIIDNGNGTYTGVHVAVVVHQPAAQPARHHADPAGRSDLGDDQRQLARTSPGRRTRPRCTRTRPSTPTTRQYLVATDKATVTYNASGHGSRDRQLQRRRRGRHQPGRRCRRRCRRWARRRRRTSPRRRPPSSPRRRRRRRTRR